MTTAEEVAQGLRELADRVDRDGLRSVTWGARLETIEVPLTTQEQILGNHRIYRPGPLQRIWMVLDWANIKPADEEIGEKSNRSRTEFYRPGGGG